MDPKYVSLPLNSGTAGHLFSSSSSVPSSDEIRTVSSFFAEAQPAPSSNSKRLQMLNPLL
ncbi:NADH-quinone oxidoreductase subunit B 2 [Frankliniella fusca]|uniref:NADH-quinone oxidoreductase subunit B 2 n=1 Tax=Frankliniella fusca TaxID=407009 RepID=A0AAE1LRD2_9NEOP|nr:NADH-quinone oxidoreductase subunit B 2 [Frankliniella fusca]